MTNTTTEIIKALADDTRLTIVRKLAELNEPTPSCDLAASCATFFKLSQPAMSHHFGKLVDAGVLVQEKQGVQKVYTLNHELLESVGINAYKL